MFIIQRVRVRWSAAARGAPEADARRGLHRPVALPSGMPASELVLHDVLFDEAAGYRPRHGTVGGDVARGRDIGLWLTVDGGALRVERLPGRAVHPRTPAMAGLFALLPGQIGRWRANFRFSLREHGWFYEDWLIHVSNGPVRDGAFGRADYEVDHRVHLYGGPVRTGRRGARK